MGCVQRHIRRCTPSCSSGMRNRHRGPYGRFVLPQLPVGQALRGMTPHAQVPTLRYRFYYTQVLGKCKRKFWVKPAQ